jgi:hypothetical protein
MGTKCHIHRIFMQGLEHPSNVISRGYLWCVYRISMDLFGYSMHILLVFYGVFVIHAIIMVSHGTSMVCLWNIHGVQWYIHGYTMLCSIDIPSASHGKSIEYSNDI